MNGLGFSAWYTGPQLISNVIQSFNLNNGGFWMEFLLTPPTSPPPINPCFN